MSKPSILVSAATLLLAASAKAITIYGLGAGGQLYSFDSASPGTVNAIGSATAAGTVDIDFRGSNNRLYAISATGATSNVSVSNGMLTPLFTPAVSLGGNVSAFDFNPTADRMRIVVDGVNNFRMVPDGISGVTAGTVVNGTAGDGMFAVPVSVTLLDVAYTNPFNGIAGTSLYSIGSDGILYTHPASGAPQFNTLAAVGSLGISLAGDIGFDIDASGTGYLVSGSSFYTVNLMTGSASLVGSLGQSLTGIAVVPEPSAILLGSIAGLGLLRRRRTA